MFPNSYSFNPGVVLDPVTMTPMISNGGAITVNPLGVPARPQQKIWQKMFIKDIPQECPNQIVLKLLNQYGSVKNFRRSLDNRGRLLSFCHFDLETGEQILRIRRLFKDIKILDKILQLKISPQTENFIKEWMTMQKDEWRKKLHAPGMNQAKQYDSIQHFHQRQDKKYNKKIDELLKTINIQVKKIAIEKMKQQQRKQHPKQKERQRKRRQYLDEIEKKFNQKQDYWLKRERQKQKQYRREREKQKQRQRTKYKRLQRQLQLDQQQQAHRISKFRYADRIKALQRQQLDDMEILEEQNPPEPEQQQIKKKTNTRFVVREQMIGQTKQQGVMAVLPEVQNIVQQKRNIKRNEVFNGWQETLKPQIQQKQIIDLKLPQIEQQKQDDEKTKKKLIEISQKVPQNKVDLWQFTIDWQLLSKSVVLQKKIRPWLEKQSVKYMGAVEQKFIALVQKKLLSKSHPDKIIKILKQLIDEDAEEFVIKLWKTLVFESLKLKQGIN